MGRTGALKTSTSSSDVAKLLERMLYQYQQLPKAQTPHEQESLTPTIAATDALVPKRVRIQYRLEGVDREWIEARDRRVATFGPLAGGQYRFLIRAANEDGRWTERTAELQRREAEHAQASAEFDAARDQLEIMGMAEEAITQTMAFMRAFDETGNISHHKFTRINAHNTQIGMQGRERIISDLWLG